MHILTYMCICIHKMCFFFVRERWEEIEDRERVREGAKEIGRESGERKTETKKGMEGKRETEK